MGLERAIASVIAEGKDVTYDLKPRRDDPTAVGTAEFGDAVIRRPRRSPACRRLKAGPPLRYQGIDARVAIVTGGNHGIGADTARALAEHGARVLVTYFRVHDPVDPGVPDASRVNRAQDATGVVEAVRRAGGHAEATEADLRHPATPVALFDAAEAAFGPVEILINNATRWRQLERLSAATASHVLEVDARGSALMIAEFARRHVARAAS